ncbi:MAG: tyrosine-type recombinase/integrase [Candidatus Curtissbacteria bacterium]|nr:tyrosine-type recombinase/integrase [Candidatus Curtissbacteria bacterium]
MKLKTEIIQRFLNAKRRIRLSPLTISRHADNLRYYRSWLRRKRITRKNNDRFIDYYQKGRMPATVNSAIATLKCFFRYLFDEGLIKEELFLYLKSMKDEPFSPILLSVSQINAIVDCPRVWSKYHSYIDRREYDFFFEFLGRCGLRRIEALRLRVQDVNFENNTFRVLGKGRKIRTLWIPKIMRGRLRSWLDERNAKPYDFVFATKEGAMASPQKYRDELKKRLALLGYDKSIHLHTFRHSFITESHKANIDTMKIMKAVGHTSFKTHNRYTHLVGEDLKDVFDENPINKIFPDADEITDEPLGIPYFLNPKEKQVN